MVILSYDNHHDRRDDQKWHSNRQHFTSYAKWTQKSCHTSHQKHIENITSKDISDNQFKLFLSCCLE